MKKIIFIAAILLIVFSCRTQKEQPPQPPVVLNNNDSTSVKTNYIQIPADSSWMKAYFKCDSNNQVIMSMFTNGSTTGLQNNTSFENGVLTSKTTKPADSVRYDIIVRVISRAYPVYVPKPYYVEKELTKWQAFQMVCGRIFLVVFGIVVFWGSFRIYKKFA